MSQTETIIHCQHLSKEFPGKKALDDVSFELHSGEPVALVGPNGAGKTTLLSILCGYLRPSAGTVSLFGHSPGSRALFARVSALPQDAEFDPLFPISQQLALYAQLQGMSIWQAAKEVHRVLELVRLKDVFYEKSTTLSHGMAKRVAIAQALIGSPALVLLDEPTAGLDPASARNIRQIVSEQSPHTTFIISSHNLSELERLCDTVLHLDNGKLQVQSSTTVSGEHSYLTIQLERFSNDDFSSTIKTLPGVDAVSQGQKNEFIIQYNQQVAPKLDQQLLACIADKGWHYRQLIKGQTLEERLFSEEERGVE